MDRDPAIAALDLRAASPAVWSEVERLRSEIPVWHPIETAPRGEEVLLYFPEIQNGRSLLPARVMVDRASGHIREPSHWMPLPAAPTI